MPIRVTIIPVLSDNYTYLIHESQSGVTGVVDPAEDEPVEHILAQHGLKLNYILNTHHHIDHTGGNLALKEAHQATVIGPAGESALIPGIDAALKEGNIFKFGKTEATVLDTPGHTGGHISFWFREADCLFCGDFLFALGCGRLLEGSPLQMWESLEKLQLLPNTCLVYCGHEYTESNLRFALSVDSKNAALRPYSEKVAQLRAQNKPTLPSTLGEEKAANPFMRCHDKRLAAAIGRRGESPLAIFTELRLRKDRA